MHRGSLTEAASHQSQQDQRAVSLGQKGTAPGSAAIGKLRLWRMDSGWLLVMVLTCLWAVGMGWLAVHRYLAFNARYDLALNTQVVWATAHGRPFYTSLPQGTTNFLARHFAPLLATLAPLYSIWPDARLLLLVQTVALAAGSLPLFAFARRKLDVRLAVLVVLAYLLSPSLHYIALTDFHEIALAVPLLMVAGSALLEGRLRAMLLWLGLALLVKEEVALVVAGFGLYVALVHRRRRLGLSLLILPLCWFLALVGMVMPAFGQTLAGFPFWQRYQALGDTLLDILRALLTRPRGVLRVVATREKALFLWQLLAPVAGLPLLGVPAVLLALPSLAYLMLADYSFMNTIRSYYTAPLLPFLFLAAVVALQRLSKCRPRLLGIGGAALALAALLSAWCWSPLPGGRAYDRAEFAVTEEDRQIRHLLADIPADAAVASDEGYLPWLANRWQLAHLLTPPLTLLERSEAPDYVLIHRPGPGGISSPLYPWIVEDRPGQALRVARFTLQSETPGGLQLWRAHGSQHDVELIRYDVTFQRGVVFVGAGLPPELGSWASVLTAAPGESIPIWMAWSARDRLEGRITFSLHLVDENGRLVSQIDQEMGQGRFPITQWHDYLALPVVADQFLLPIPPSLPPDDYLLLVGAYESETVTPLEMPVAGQWFELATVLVGERVP